MISSNIFIVFLCLLGHANVTVKPFSAYFRAAKVAPYRTDLSSNSQIDISINAVDLEDRTFLINFYKDKGYEIIDKETGMIFERSFSGTPSFFKNQNNIYYFGPTYYYTRIGDIFYPLHQKVGNAINLSQAVILQRAFSKQINEIEKMDFLKNSEMKKPSSKSDSISYIPNYTRIKNDPYPDNWDNTCGFVAASIVFHYWDVYASGHIVAQQFKNINGQLNSTLYYSPSTNLKDKLVEYNGGNNASWGYPVRDSMVDYCNDHNVTHNVWWGVGKYTPTSSLDNELLNGRPVIIFGLLPDQETLGFIAHAVTAYGWHIYESIIGSYIVNYGWSEEATNEVEINIGLVGSITTFQPLSWPMC